MSIVQISRGYSATVDAADLHKLEGLKWLAHTAPGGLVYAVARPLVDGRRAIIYMHRHLIGALPDEIVDHEDGDGLNNRRRNIRRCTHQQNMRNAGKWGARPTSSRFKGVYQCKQTGRWHARIECDGRRVHLGRHETEEAAAHAYDTAARSLFGEFARLNFADRAFR